MKMKMVCELGLAYWMYRAENGPHGSSGRQPPPRVLCGLSFADLYAYDYINLSGVMIERQDKL